MMALCQAGLAFTFGGFGAGHFLIREPHSGQSFVEPSSPLPDSIISLHAGQTYSNRSRVFFAGSDSGNGIASFSNGNGQRAMRVLHFGHGADEPASDSGARMVSSHSGQTYSARMIFPQVRVFHPENCRFPPQQSKAVRLFCVAPPFAYPPESLSAVKAEIGGRITTAGEDKPARMKRPDAQGRAVGRRSCSQPRSRPASRRLNNAASSSGTVLGSTVERNSLAPSSA